MTELTSLAEIVERAERLVASSAADATSIAWVESHEGEVLESAHNRRAGAENRRSVLFRVRVGGRTGRARAESALPGRKPMPGWEMVACDGWPRVSWTAAPR